MKLNKKNIAIIIIAILLSIISFIILDYFHYECPYRKFFHIYCPGCGTSRMIKALFRLDIYQAFRYNPLMFIIIVILLPIYIIMNVIKYIHSKTFYKITKKQIIILFIIMILYFILRNLEIGVYFIPTEV